MSAIATVLLKEVASFIRGITFKPDDVVRVGSDGSVACMRTKNVQSELDLSDVWGVSESLVKRDDQYLVAGDLLVSSANSWNLVGKCCWVPVLPWRATFGGFISVLRGNSAKVDPRYLYHWFSSPRIQSTVRSFGQQTTNISNLNIDRCLRLPLPLPRLPEQRRIAGILDKTDALRAKRRDAIAKLDILARSIFLDMFGDPGVNPSGYMRKQLHELVREGDSINYGVVQPGENCEDGVPLIRVGDLQNGKVEKSRLKRISPSIEVAYKRSRLRGDEVLVSCVGSTGVIALADESVEGFNIARAVARVPLADSINREFMAGYLQTEYVQRYFKSELRTVSQPTLNIKQIAELAVVLPSFERQREFARRVGAVGQIADRERESLSGLDTAFATIQDSAFRGEI